jgi:hypothetical protein
MDELKMTLRQATDLTEVKEFPTQGNYWADIRTTAPSPHWLFGPT